MKLRKTVPGTLPATEIRDLIIWCDALIVVYSEVDPSSLRLDQSSRQLIDIVSESLNAWLNGSKSVRAGIIRPLFSWSETKTMSDH